MKLPMPTQPDPLAPLLPGEHLTAELLRLVTSGALPPEHLVWLLLGHLLEVCPDCGEAIGEIAAATEEPVADGEPPAATPLFLPSSYRPAFEAAWARVAAAAAHRGDAAAALTELQALPWGERFGRVAAEPDLPMPDLCTRLLRQGRGDLAADPGEAERCARLALAAAERLDPRRFPQGLIVDLQAEGWVLLGEARAAQDDGAGAELALANAQSLAEAGSGDPLTLAAVAGGRARLLRLRGELEACLGELRRAGDLCRAGGDPHVMGETLVRQGLVLRDLGHRDEAQATIRAGLAMLEPGRASELSGTGWAALLESLDAVAPY
jgi:hypothetical protein